MRKILLDIRKGPKHWYNEMVKAKMGPFEIAFGFSVGVFCTMIALPVANLLLALLAIALLRVNKLAVMMGYLIVLWPLSPFIYYASLRLGFFLFGKGLTISISEISFEVIKRYVAIFAIGNIILATSAAAAAFFAAYSMAKLVEIIKKRKQKISPPNDGAI